MSPNGEHGLTTEPVGEFVVKKSSVWWWRTLVSLHLPQKISSILKKDIGVLSGVCACGRRAPEWEGPLGRSTAHIRWDLGVDPD